MLHLGPIAPSTQEAVPDWPRRLHALAASARDARLRAFYRADWPGGETPLHALPMVALDVETTGLDAQAHEIVSVGVVPLALGHIRCSATRQWIVKPRGPLNAASVTIHGITHSQVEAAPDFDAVIEPLLAAMAGRVAVVHGRAIERSFLAAALMARLGEGIEFPVIDTMELEARLHRARPLSLLARWRGQRPVSIRLADARARHGLPRYRPHHAATDALAAAELLLAQVAQRFTPDTPVRALWR